MFFYPSEQEGLAWPGASDEAWADRAGVAYEAAGGKSRRDDDDPAEGPAP